MYLDREREREREREPHTTHLLLRLGDLRPLTTLRPITAARCDLGALKKTHPRGSRLYNKYGTIFTFRILEWGRHSAAGQTPSQNLGKPLGFGQGPDATPTSDMTNMAPSFESFVVCSSHFWRSSLALLSSPLVYAPFLAIASRVFGSMHIYALP